MATLSTAEPSGPCGAPWHSATPVMKTDHGRAAAGHDPFCTFLGERARMSIECLREETNRPPPRNERGALLIEASTGSVNRTLSPEPVFVRAEQAAACSAAQHRRHGVVATQDDRF